MDYFQELIAANVITIVNIDELDRTVILCIDKTLGICEFQADRNL